MLGAASVPLMAQACASDPDREVPLELERFRGTNPPASVEVQVRRARKNQPILAKAEHLSIDPALTAYLGLGDQCRVLRGEDSYALYTVGQLRSENSETRVRMGMQARSRLGTTDTFDAILSTTVVAEGLSDQEAKDLSEFVERLVDDGQSQSFIALAPHGGFIERHTDDQAELMQSLLADQGASSWLCKGYREGGGAYERWHITSTDISPNSFPGLDLIADRGFAYALSFHGTSLPLVVVGGGGPQWLREGVREVIAGVLAGSGIEVCLSAEVDLYPGDNPGNIVNWLTAGGAGGVQLEQSLPARELYGLAIAEALAEYYAQLL
ncbi:poly-gamma-glutamate hydrolase family protein [Plesiocystis pacifica]|nr:poly-gamma-glutamate hydrolase family protein [Plesiocystis pacifica]